MNSCRVNRSYYNDSGRSWIFSVSEKIARYGCSSLSGAEHFSLLVGTDSLADALLRHFGSLKALCRASFKDLRQFLPRPKAEGVRRRFRWALLLRRKHALLAFLSTPKSICGGRHFVILAYSLSDTGDITAAMPSFAARSDRLQHSGLFLEKRGFSTTCKIFAQNDDLPGTVAGPCRRRNSGAGAKDDRKATAGFPAGQTSNWA